MEEAVKNTLGTKKFLMTGMGGGGCISSGQAYQTDDKIVFVKRNDKPNAKTMFDGEKAGLEAILETKKIRAPIPYTVVNIPGSNSSAIVLEYIKLGSMSSNLQKELGIKLAKMHLYNKSLLEKANNSSNFITKSEEENFSTKKFGFPVTTCCGYLSQDNTWQDKWDVFYIRQKLQLQVDMLLQSKGDRQLNDIWPICMRKIEDKLKNVEVIPACLHGDLWSGNIASADGKEPLIFDPASFYGHSEYEFGIANMFGGFTSSFFESYHSIIPQANGFLERKPIYELFHHLNHWNHFGSSYKGSTIRIMNEISKD